MYGYKNGSERLIAVCKQLQNKLDHVGASKGLSLEDVPQVDLCMAQYAASRDEITEATGKKRSTRDAYIQRLKAKKLVVVTSSGIKLAEHLFE